MTMTQRLQKTQPENLRKISDHQLESDSAIVSFSTDGGKKSILFDLSKRSEDQTQLVDSPALVIGIYDKKTGDFYQFANENGFYEISKYGKTIAEGQFQEYDWEVEAGPVAKEEFESLEKVIEQKIPCCEEGMRKALTGIVIQREYGLGFGIHHPKDVEDNEKHLMSKGLSRAGLSVSKNGKISDMRNFQAQNQVENG